MKVNVHALKTAISLAATQCNDFTVRPTDEGWELLVLGAGHTTMIRVMIHKSAFQDYEVWGDFAFDSADALDALSTAKDTVDIDISTGRLIMKSNGLKYRKKLVAIQDDTRARIPSLDLDAQVVFSIDRLSQLISKGEKKYGTVLMNVDDDMFTAVVEDEQEMGVTLELPLSDCEMILGQARARYPLKPWDEFLKALPKGARLDMQFRSDYPLVATYTSEGFDAMWMVAPHIDQGD